VQEGSFDVKLMEIPAQGRSNVEDSPEGFETCRRHGSFVIVDTIALSIAFGNVPNLISNDVASVVTFLLAD
jgi:hypothetical protein